MSKAADRRAGEVSPEMRRVIAAARAGEPSHEEYTGEDATHNRGEQHAP